MTTENSEQQGQKVEIEIIGSRFDKVTTILEAFKPGDKRFIHSYETMGIASRGYNQVKHNEIEVKVPARLPNE
jgi:hypothetical protein